MKIIQSYLIIIFCILIISCQENVVSKKTSKELEKIFTTEEIIDLNTLVGYFESKIRIEGKDIEQCYKDWFWTVQNNGYESVYNIDIFKFEDQTEVYRKISESTFNEIWVFTRQYNLESKDTLKVVSPNIDGKYIKYIKEIGKRRKEVKDYFDSIDWAFEYGMVSAFPVFLKRDTLDNNWEFRNGFEDYNDKVILTIMTLTVVDEYYRKEKWKE